MEKWTKVKNELLKDKRVKEEYRKLAPKYEVFSQLIGLRLKSGLTQKDLAKKMKTKQSAIARLESGNYNPSLSFLQKTAEAVGKKLVISFE